MNGTGMEFQFQTRFRIYTRTVSAKLHSAIDLDELRKFATGTGQHDDNDAKCAFSNSISLRFNVCGSRIHVKVFRTGSVQTAGSPTNEIAVRALGNVHRFITVACESFPLIVARPEHYRLDDIKTNMIYGVFTHPETVDRELFYEKLRRMSSFWNFSVRYDRSLHNAIIVRFTKGEGTFLIFKSGKIIMTGGTSVDHYEKWYRRIFGVSNTGF